MPSLAWKEGMIGWRQDAVLMFRGAYQVVFVIAEFCPTSEDLTPSLAV
jgi:hypothetical protein